MGAHRYAGNRFGAIVKFSQQSESGINLVRACSAEEIRVGEHTLTASAILTADRIVDDWPPRAAGELTAQHMRAVLALEPELILLGTGEHQQFPDRGVLRVAQDAGVAIEVMDTRAACRTYNVLVQEGRRVAAAVLVGSPGRAPGEDTGNKSIDHQPIIRS